jgi:glycine/D-amino acid oxidase-like deaminating enzyme
VPAYARQRGDLEVDVAIVGGGLTGCATAYAFAAAGVSVALFEADRIGRDSGRSAGWITTEPPAPFLHLDAAVGRRASRQGWQTWRRAALDLQALIRRLDLKCRLEARSGLTVAQTPAQAALLAREQKARRDAGLDGAVVPARAASASAGFAVQSAAKNRDDAAVDPYRLTLGLAAAAADRGAQLFERSPVTRTAFTRDTASVTLSAGSVRAQRVIVCTGTPTRLFAALARHFSNRVAYNVLTEPVPARIRQALGSRELFLRDSADPAHRVARVDEGRLLVSGADSDPVPERLRGKQIVQRTGQLMYELSLLYPDISGLQAAYGWDAAYATTPHGLPVIGPHRNFPHHLFAFGGGGHSLTAAYLASRVLLRHHQSEVHPADDAFGFSR